MRLVHLIKSIIASIIILGLPTTMCGQEEYAAQFEIMSNASALFQENKVDDALQLLRINKDNFEQDELTEFWYNWLNAVILYESDRQLEANTHIEKSIAFLDIYLDDLLANAENINNYLVVYYYAPDINFKLGAKTEDIINGLEHAKFIYEKAKATSEPIYKCILNDLESLRINIAALCVEALNNFMTGNYHAAIPQFIQIIDYAKIHRPDDALKLVAWMKSLAFSYMNIGDYNNSEKYYLMSLDLLKSNNLQKEPIYRMVLDALSVLYINLQNYEKANILNGKAKNLYEEALDFGDDYVRCLNNSALIQNGLGYNTVAKMQLDVALRQAEANLSNKISMSETMATIEQFMNQPIDPRTLDGNYYIQTRIIPYVTMLSNAAVVYSDLGYFAEAVRTARKSIQLAEEYGLDAALSYNNLGGIYFYKSKFPQSVKWYHKGYDLSKTPHQSDEIGFNVALSKFLSKDAETAKFGSEFSAKMRRNIQDMFAFMSGEERAIYWKHFENYLPLLNMFIYENGQPDYYGAIYDNILESKGLLLRSTNAIRDAIMNSGNVNDRNDYERMINLKQLLQNETNDSLRAEYSKEIENIDKRLTRNVNSYSDFASSQCISWQDVRNNLGNGDIAIEFYNIPIVWGLDSIHTMDGEPRYCAVILKKNYDNPVIIPLCKERELEELDNEDLYETDIVYNLIWKPLEIELNGVKNIYFAADRELHKIGIEYAPTLDGKKMGDQYNIHRLSSTRVLAENWSPSKSDNAVLYGGLKYDMDKDSLVAESRSGDYHPASASRAFTDENLRYGVKYLPGTLKEVEDISQNFTDKPRIITDINGTEESFKALAGTPVDIIHLATHGFFWNDEEAKKRDYVSFLKNNKAQQSMEDNALLRSGLFFSGANIGLMGEPLPDDVEDGVLTALELSNMNLGNVDMVIMSACESGLGETSGEGVFGLQRGFKLAGANTLLMSLWKVDDTATQILMTEFYHNYLSGKSKQESLRLAQQYLRNCTDGEEDYSDPKYWAAFILLDALN